VRPSLHLITFLALSLPTSSLLHAFELAPFSASYRFNIDNKLSGTATRTMEKKAGDSWRYTFAANAHLATATETSDFRFNGSTVTPLSYVQNRKIFFVKKKNSVNFDWKKNIGTGTRSSSSSVTYALQAGTLDTLNLEIQIRRDLKDLGKLAGPYFLATPKELVPLPFVIEGEEVLDTPVGKLKTLKVRRIHNDPKRHTSFWLAKELDYLPAKVTQNDDGAIYTIELTSYKKAAK
jgi:hypothetical protein